MQRGADCVARDGVRRCLSADEGVLHRSRGDLRSGGVSDEAADGMGGAVTCRGDWRASQPCH